MTGQRQKSWLLFAALVTVASALTIAFSWRSGVLPLVVNYLLTPPRPTVILLIMICVTGFALVWQLAPTQWAHNHWVFLQRNLGGSNIRRVLAAVAGIAITVSLLRNFYRPEMGAWRLILILVVPATVFVAVAELVAAQWVAGQYGTRIATATRQFGTNVQYQAVNGWQLFKLTYKYLLGALLMGAVFAVVQRMQPDMLPSWAPLGPFLMLFVIWAFHTGRAQIRLIQLLNRVGFIYVRRSRPIIISGITHTQTYNAWEWRPWRTVWSLVICALLYIMLTHRPWGLYAAIFLFLVWSWAFLAYRVQRVFGTNDDPNDYKSLAHPVRWGFIPMGLAYLKWWPLRIPAMFPALILLPFCFLYSEYENWSWLYSQGWFWIMISVPMIYWIHYWKAAWPREGYGITNGNEIVKFRPTIGWFPDSEKLSAKMTGIGETVTQPNALGFALRIVFQIRFISNRPTVEPIGPVVLQFVPDTFVNDLRAAAIQANVK